jgi:cytochrome c oxidase subunit 3
MIKSLSDAPEKKLFPDDDRSALLGMWIFLATEILLFSMLFLTFGIYRHLYTSDFDLGTQHLNLGLGAVNTLILLTSSFSMALGIHFQGKSRTPFYATIGLGFLFLVLKGIEYYQHYQEGLMPIVNWHPAEAAPHLLLFFFLYFFMTALHAFHLIIGLGLVAVVAKHGEKKPEFRENIGLYWHFVDLVWIFLLPCLYLIGRTSS